jgi:hypothetical protein
MKRLTPFILAAAMVILLAGLIFEMREVLDAREQLATLKEQNAAAMAEIDALNQDIHASKLANANLGRENRRLQSLVAQSGTLPTEPHHSKEAQPDPPDPQDPLSQMIDPYVKKALLLNQHLQEMPSEKIPELSLLTADDWLKAGAKAKFDTDDDVRKSLRTLREIAKNELPLGSGLYTYVHANDGNLPADMAQLAPYLRFPVDSSILSRYTIQYQGNISSLPEGAWVIFETSPPVDPQWDNQAKFGVGTSTIMDLQPGNSADNGQP